jgi:hypothetical protein
MIEPTEADIGRRVVYSDHSGLPSDWRDHGVITRITHGFVFVRYGRELGAKATHREDLEWESPSNPSPDSTPES